MTPGPEERALLAAQLTNPVQAGGMPGPLELAKALLGQGYAGAMDQGGSYPTSGQFSIAHALGMPSVLDRMIEQHRQAQARMAGGDMAPPRQPSADDLALADQLVNAFAAPIKAYHGSPHVFDKFSLERIGTGEGAQSYGHGLYFAENPNVAEAYKKVVPADSWEAFNRLADEAGNLNVGGKLFRSPKALRDAVLSGQVDRGSVPPDLGDLARADSSFYDVTLKVEPDQLLDWDKPLSEQPEKVRAALAPLFPQAPSEIVDASRGQGRAFEVVRNGKVLTSISSADLGGKLRWRVSAGPNIVGSFDDLAEAKAAALDRAGKLAKLTEPKGGDLYRELVKQLSAPAAASDALQKAGIPGIRYLDAFSRNAKEGSRNIVLFDDALAQIDAHNGQPLNTTQKP